MNTVQELSKEKIKEIIAKRTVKEFKCGDVVTLGIGLPTAIANFVPEEMHVMMQSENGFLGVSKNATDETRDEKIINAGGIFVEAREGACFYDAQMAFTIMRGGHLDATVLGALQVDEEGSIANWLIPNKLTPGMGGAMDLVVGSKKVIVAMEHTSKGEVKIVKKCDLPLTAYREVDMIVTERCVFKVLPEGKGLLLTDINPMFSIEDIKSSTDADFTVADDLQYMEI